MKRYFCNGKKGYCDRGNDNKIDCTACEFASGTGGEIVDCPDTNFEKIKAMSIDEMVEKFAKNGYCEFCKLKESQTCDNPCEQGIRQYLESEVEEE